MFEEFAVEGTVQGVQQVDGRDDLLKLFVEIEPYLCEVLYTYKAEWAKVGASVTFDSELIQCGKAIGKLTYDTHPK